VIEPTADGQSRGSPPPEGALRERYLGKGVAVPDLVTVKGFIRFYAATSRPRLFNVPTDESINTVVEWFFAGFTRCTGTETDEENRSEVYNAGCPFSQPPQIASILTLHSGYDLPGS
jgi:hypothetical protein